MTQKFKKGDSFTLEDFREQLIEMKKMGGMMSMLEKIPGARNLPDHVKSQVDDKMFNKMEAIINSMTLKSVLIRILLKVHADAELHWDPVHKCKM